jgi:hypothetical protein
MAPLQSQPGLLILLSAAGSALVGLFVEEEFVHQWLDLTFPHWTDRPGLAAARPLRPAVAEAVEADDAVISDIGKSLLALALRRTAATWYNRASCGVAGAPGARGSSGLGKP